MIENSTDSKYTFDVNSYSDIYKETYNVRPHYDGFYDPKITNDERQAMWDRLLKEHDRIMRAEEIQEAESIKNFEQTVELAINAGARNRETAIKWLKQSFQDEEILKDEDWFKFKMGIPYSYEL